MATTWTYLNLNGKRFTITTERGRVIASDNPSYPVGAKVSAKQLKACDWRKPKPVVQYDAWGRRIG